MRNKEELRKAIKVLKEFIEEVPIGESYWIDDEGEIHNVDMGYICDFFADLEDYLDGVWVSKKEKELNRWPTSCSVEILLKSGDLKIFYTQDVEIQEDLLLIIVNPYHTVKVYKKDILRAIMRDFRTQTVTDII